MYACAGSGVFPHVSCFSSSIFTLLLFVNVTSVLHHFHNAETEECWRRQIWHLQFPLHHCMVEKAHYLHICHYHAFIIMFSMHAFSSQGGKRTTTSPLIPSATAQLRSCMACSWTTTTTPSVRWKKGKGWIHSSSSVPATRTSAMSWSYSTQVSLLWYVRGAGAVNTMLTQKAHFFFFYRATWTINWSPESDRWLLNVQLCYHIRGNIVCVPFGAGQVSHSGFIRACYPQTAPCWKDSGELQSGDHFH